MRVTLSSHADIARKMKDRLSHNSFPPSLSLLPSFSSSQSSSGIYERLLLLFYFYSDYVCMYICVCVCMYVCIYIYVYMKYVYIYICVYNRGLF